MARLDWDRLPAAAANLHRHLHCPPPPQAASRVTRARERRAGAAVMRCGIMGCPPGSGRMPSAPPPGVSARTAGCGNGMAHTGDAAGRGGPEAAPDTVRAPAGADARRSPWTGRLFLPGVVDAGGVAVGEARAERAHDTGGVPARLAVGLRAPRAGRGVLHAGLARHHHAIGDTIGTLY